MCNSSLLLSYFTFLFSLCLQFLLRSGFLIFVPFVLHRGFLIFVPFVLHRGLISTWTSSVVVSFLLRFYSRFNNDCFLGRVAPITNPCPRPQQIPQMSSKSRHHQNQKQPRFHQQQKVFSSSFLLCSIEVLSCAVCVSSIHTQQKGCFWHSFKVCWMIPWLFGVRLPI